MKNKIFLSLKSMIITIFVMLFLFLMFIVYNQGIKKIHGQSLSLSFQNSSIYIKDGNSQITIKPDIENVAKILNFIDLHPQLLPYPLFAMNMAKYIISIYRNILK